MARPTVDDIIQALALPDHARVDQRVPKKMLAEHGAPTAADRRLLTDGIEEVRWIAALKPATVAIPAYRDNEREYLEVAVLSVHARVTHAKPAQQVRLAELVHRAIPYPVLLIQTLATDDSNDKPPPIALSLAHKRASQNEAGRVVLDGDLIRTDLASGAFSPAALLRALDLTHQPHQDLMALYQGWMDCLTAAEVARITGRFALSDNVTQSATRREALRTCQRLELQAVSLRSQASKERQIAKRVDLNLALQRLQTELEAARARL